MSVIFHVARISLDSTEHSVIVFMMKINDFRNFATKRYLYPLSYSSPSSCALGMDCKIKYNMYAIYSQCAKTASKENNHAYLL